MIKMGRREAPNPTDEIDVVAFGYKPNKDFYVTLHNKKETRGSLLSACFYIAIELNLEREYFYRLQ